MEAFIPMTEHILRLAVPFPGCWTGVVLVQGGQTVLVDSGGTPEAVDQCIVPALAALGLAPADLDALLLTHLHGDHVGGAARLKALAPRMRIGVLAASAARLADPLAYSRQIRSRFPAHSPAPPAALPGVQADWLLSDGDTIGALTLIHTPGHDTDCVCYLDHRTRTLITGDSLQFNGTCSQGCALLMDIPAYGATLSRLAALDPQTIVCGHPYLPLGGEAIGHGAARAFLAAAAACHERDGAFVRAMQKAGETDEAAIARALIRLVGGQPPTHLFLPLYTVTGYLKHP